MIVPTLISLTITTNKGVITKSSEIQTNYVGLLYHYNHFHSLICEICHCSPELNACRADIGNLSNLELEDRIISQLNDMT